MNPDDKPPPYSEVYPHGQEYQPQMQGPPVTRQPVQMTAGGAPLSADDRVPLTGGPPTSYGSVTYVTTHTVPAHEVIIVGGCPACRIGVLEDDFSCLGIFCAIFFFPLGILCCLATRQRRCPNCGAIFG